MSRLLKEAYTSRLEKTAEYHEIVGKREWAYAKNGKGNEHYGKAKSHFSKADDLRNKARNI